MGSNSCVLSIDAGGSYFKSALVLPDGALVESSEFTLKVNSDGPASDILASYEQIIQKGLATAESNGLKLAGIGVAAPGPFDFSAGRSLMTHKFASLYGLDLRQKLQLFSDCENIRFIHDVFAFLLGENRWGAARGFRRVAAVTIGTGLGFGCVIDGKPLGNELNSPHIALYKEPYGGGIVEDFVSGRGIVKLYGSLSGRDVSGLDAKKIADLAYERHDQHAVKAYSEVGRILGEILAPIILDLQLQCLVFGGQICRSTDLIFDALREKLDHIPCLERISPGEHIDSSSLLGAAALIVGS